MGYGFTTLTLYLFALFLQVSRRAQMEEIKALLKEIPGRIGSASLKERKHVFEQLEKAIKTGMPSHFLCCVKW